MDWLRRGLRRLRILFRKEEVDAELDAELRHHIELEARELERQGMDPEEARREAHRRFGGVERTKERVRDERGGRLLDDLIQDLGYGIRTLRKSPGFTASALLILALGIGASTALFGVVEGVLLEPLPFPQSDRLVRVWPASPSRGIERAAFSYPDFRDWRARSDATVGMGLYTELPADYPILGDAGPEEVETVWVGGDFFGTLGVDAAVGRTIRPREVADGLAVVVLSHGFWQRRYGGDPSIVGTSITLDHRPFEVVGVMPPDFGFPNPDAEVWTPVTVIPEDDIPIQLRQVRFPQAVARLAPGTSLEAAREELSTIAGRLEEEYPDSNAGVDAATVVPLHDSMVGDVETALWMLLGAVGLVLLLACANVANLLLARGTSRSREVAIRVSMGASTGRITRQLLTESLLLGLSGGALGVGLAWLGTDALLARSAGILPRAGAVELDAPVLAVALLVTLAATVAAGMVPAIRGSKVEPGDELREGTRGGGAGVQGLRLRRTLVASEVALAVVLLVGAGLMIRSVRAMNRVDPGFETEGRLAATITISDQKHPDRAEWMAMYRQILDRMERLPAVEEAGAIRYLPFRGEGEAAAIRVRGLYEPTPEEQRYARTYQVSEDLFRALGVPVLQGRGFRPGAGPDDPVTGVVNRAFVREFLQGEDALGRRVQVGGSELEIVGVVGDVRHAGLGEEAPPVLYVNQEQIPRIQMSYVFETDGDPLALVDDLRRVVRELDPDQAISEITPLSRLLGEQTARPRFYSVLLGAFAALALVLAALGVYGVLAYAVRERAREMGLRMALGATAGRVMRGVVRQGLAPVAVGLALGLAGAAGLSRLVETVFFGVQPGDPLTYLAVAALLALIATAACLVPAWWATRVDPMRTLRAE